MSNRLTPIDTLQDAFIACSVAAFPQANQVVIMSNESADIQVPYIHVLFNHANVEYDKRNDSLNTKSVEIKCCVIYAYDLETIYGGATGFTTPYQALNYQGDLLVEQVYNNTAIKSICNFREFDGIVYEVTRDNAPSYALTQYLFTLTASIINN